MSTTLNNSNEFREQGNQAFKQGHFQEAIDRYTDALNSLNNLQLSETNKTDLTKCYSNRAQCYINLGQYDDAVEDTTRGRNRFI
jgi:tetratricopeptide (TPR) repeat protein